MQWRGCTDPCTTTVGFMLRFYLVGLTLALSASSAFACTVPTPTVYDATQNPADAVIEGVVTGRGLWKGEPVAEVRVAAVHVGVYALPSFRLGWWSDIGGMCAPPGPPVDVGQRVIIYLGRIGGTFRALGWVRAAEHPRSKAKITQEQAVALLRARRQRQFFRAGGALSYNDPAGWLNIEDIPELRGSKGMVLVSFEVSPSGKLLKCTAGHVAKYVKLDRSACRIIEKRARLVPPIFEDETHGSFEMYPPN